MPDLQSLLGSELDAAKGFLSLLKEEESALVAGDVDRLSAIVNEKYAHLQQISRLTQERLHQLPPSDAIAWLENHPEASKLWQELIRVSEEIRLTNEINGKMIDVRLRSTQQALNMLNSLVNQTTNLYGPDGQASVGIQTGLSRDSA